MGLVDNVDLRNPLFEAHWCQVMDKKLKDKNFTLPDELLGLWDGIPLHDVAGRNARNNEAKMRASLARKYAARAGIAMTSTVIMANMALTGHPPWENAEGHKGDIELPYKTADGKKQYMSLGKQIKEPLEWASNPQKRLKSKISLTAKSSIRILSGTDFLGKPLIGDDEPLGGVLGYAELVASTMAEQLAPQVLEKPKEFFTGNRDPRSVALDFAGWPVGSEFIRERAEGKRKRTRSGRTRTRGLKNIATPRPPSATPSSLTPGGK